MEERLRFIARLLDGEKMAGLCRELGISPNRRITLSLSPPYLLLKSYLSDNQRVPLVPFERVALSEFDVTGMTIEGVLVADMVLVYRRAQHAT